MATGRLKYGVEFTKNLGNFENVKPSFELAWDVDFHDEKSLTELKDKMAEIVDDWLVAKVDELAAEISERS